MLHHVAPARPSGFDPNGLLSITPEFLEQVVVAVRRRGWDIVSMDEAHRRMTGESVSQRPYACFTFDDGYRDNRDYAYPVLKRLGVPFTIYVTADFAEGRGFLWWLVLERVVARRQFIAVEIAGRVETMRCVSDRDKSAAFDRIYWWLRSMPEIRARALVAAMADEAGVDPLEPCRELAMDWDEIRELAADPLVTIGAHTLRHMALAKLPAAEAQVEIARSVGRVEEELGRPCRHFCYPYGDRGSADEREFEIVRRLGLATAVTTRKGLIGAQAAHQMAALPRVSLNGNFQQIACVEALLSGVPFALWDLLGRIRPTRPAFQPALSPDPVSGFCIQRTNQAAGTTQARPAITKKANSATLEPTT